MSNVKIEYDDGNSFVHKITCNCGHIFRVRGERDFSRPESRFEFQEVLVGCPKCGEKLLEAVAGAIKPGSLSSAFRIDVRWTGDELALERRLETRSRLDEAAQGRGFFGSATLEYRNAEDAMVVEAASIDELSPADARTFVEDVLRAAGVERAL
jgi:hypothetical protein